MRTNVQLADYWMRVWTRALTENDFDTIVEAEAKLSYYQRKAEEAPQPTQ